MRRLNMLALVLVVTCAMCLGTAILAQQPAAAPVAAAPAAAPAAADEGDQNSAVNFSFFYVVTSSGFLGVLLWVALFADMFAGIWLIVDCGITVRASKIMPQSLVDRVSESMAQGDVLKALSNCEDYPGPMASILTAGFSHVEEGFDTIQEAVAVAADLESEKMSQRISYISVVAALAPMLGLLGTVQGMIAAFANLARMGAAVISVLAANIGQALYTTAAGLMIAVPTIAFFNFYRNRANRIILRMQAITLELIKDLRNVEVVQE